MSRCQRSSRRSSRTTTRQRAVSSKTNSAVGDHGRAFARAPWVSGRFDSGDVSVNIEPSNIDGWRLDGRFPGSKSLWAKARCVTPPAGSIPGAFIGPTINWSQGKSSVQTTLTSRSFVCGLSSMRGNFNGKGEYLYAFRARNEANTDTVWWLGGGSAQTGVGGQMTCAGP